MKKVKNYNVIIIGGGVAGITAALYLKKFGINNICILENQKYPRAKPCTGLITLAAYKLLLEIDIDPLKDLNYITDFVKSGTKIFSKGNLKVTMHNNENLFCPNNATRTDFDYYLYRKVKETDVDFIEQVKVSDINFLNKNISTLNEQYTYNYLIFADGINGISSKYSKINKKSICFDAVFPKKSSSSFYNLYFGITKTGYAWIGETKNYCTIGLSDQYNYKKNIDYKKILVNFAKDNGYEIDENIIRGAFVPMKLSKNIVMNNSVIMIGDAAGLTDPLTMEGIYEATYSAKKAALAISKGNVKLYKKEIKSLISNQRVSNFLSTFFFKKNFQKFFWNGFAKLFKSFISYGYDKIVMEKEHLMIEGLPVLIKFYFNKRKKQ